MDGYTILNTIGLYGGNTIVLINFSKFKVQGLDIATLLGAEGPQQDPQGPALRGPKGSPTLRRS